MISTDHPVSVCVFIDRRIITRRRRPSMRRNHHEYGNTATPARRNGRRGSSRAISGECLRSTKPLHDIPGGRQHSPDSRRASPCSAGTLQSQHDDVSRRPRCCPKRGGPDVPDLSCLRKIAPLHRATPQDIKARCGRRSRCSSAPLQVFRASRSDTAPLYYVARSVHRVTWFKRD